MGMYLSSCLSQLLEALGWWQKQYCDVNKPVQLNEITAHIIIDLINKYIYIYTVITKAVRQGSIINFLLSLLIRPINMSWSKNEESGFITAKLMSHLAYMHVGRQLSWMTMSEDSFHSCLMPSWKRGGGGETWKPPSTQSSMGLCCRTPLTSGFQVGSASGRQWWDVRRQEQKTFDYTYMYS